MRTYASGPRVSLDSTAASPEGRDDQREQDEDGERGAVLGVPAYQTMIATVT
jgi:hypothetical protein